MPCLLFSPLVCPAPIWHLKNKGERLKQCEEKPELPPGTFKLLLYVLQLCLSSEHDKVEVSLKGQEIQLVIPQGPPLGALPIRNPWFQVKCWPVSTACRDVRLPFSTMCFPCKIL